MFLRSKTIVLFVLIFWCGATFALAQNAAENKTENKEKAEKKENQEKSNAKPAPLDPKNLTVEQIVESVIAVYGGSVVGRETLNQIRKTTFERGRLILTAADGKTENANYERWVLRGENLTKERVRFDQTFPNAKFALIYTGDKIFGVFNDQVFLPREDASSAFQNQIWHGLEAILRYKENDSKINLAGRDTQMGVAFYLIDVTDKQDRKTRFYVSTKTFRVMQLEYESAGVQYRRKFYDYNYAQGTLVPYRTVLWANNRQVEEIQIQTITFGQKVEENMFREG